MNLDIDIIKKFFNEASGHQFRLVMAEMDKMQDEQDQKQGKHVPIILTVSILAELIHRAEIRGQRKEILC